MTRAPEVQRTPETGFEVQAWAEWVAASMSRRPRLWKRLAEFENWLLQGELRQIDVDRPVWVCGLARSGTTILLEILCQHPLAAYQRYRDYPFIWLPYLWNTLLHLLPRAPEKAAERTHRDRILVTSNSPEAMEEPLWMAFWPQAHDPRRSAILDEGTHHPEFQACFQAHIRKVLLANRARRYIAKGNYNVTRLAYLRRMFPDAKFVVMVREPAAHIASLRKQHDHMTRGLEGRPAARAHLRHIGHYEFGPDRAPINCGDDEAIRRVLDCWNSGDEIGGWAHYWAHVYGAVASLGRDPRLADAILLVRYEDLCAQPARLLGNILEHCQLDMTDQLRAHAARLSAPDYYTPNFSETDAERIREITRGTARKVGY